MDLHNPEYLPDDYQFDTQASYTISVCMIPGNKCYHLSIITFNLSLEAR